ncbi:hypothetical protein AAP_05648 [Ascosphaera apis ARSEF 7405]|uniref:Uncharacterized protein n=1 Tax=Ascosphaera apis ARSEF 7405 TaxID=392613 RepID=A0A167VEI7_9EURO|nr:hypothetical protein AAP_05648 [Ascosphaera apis ARSEF 7405]
MVRSLGFLALLTGSAFGAALEARDQPSAGVSSSVGPSSTWTWPSGPKPTTSQASMTASTSDVEGFPSSQVVLNQKTPFSSMSTSTGETQVFESMNAARHHHFITFNPGLSYFVFIGPMQRTSISQ